MFRRTFLGTLASLFGWRAAAQAPTTDDGLSPVLRNGKAHARFFRRGADNKWREVEPEDIKHGDDIIALAVENGELWSALRSVINDIWVDPKVIIHLAHPVRIDRKNNSEIFPLYT